MDPLGGGVFKGKQSPRVMVIRRGGVTVTDIPWFFVFFWGGGGGGGLEIKCVIAIQHFTTVVIMVQPYHSLGC